MKQFKNLIFDIGEVIIHLDFPLTIAEFQKLTVVDFGEIISYSREHKVFDRFEKGILTPRQFRNELRTFMKPGITEDDFNAAWNSVLAVYPENKISLLKELKTRYRTFALSNTNEIHVSHFNRAAREKFGEKDFGSFFHRAYYSNEIGFRKPEHEIYELIMNKENLVPSETFFVDDLPENIEAAKSVGLKAYLLKDRNKLHELLAELKII